MREVALRVLRAVAGFAAAWGLFSVTADLWVAGIAAVLDAAADLLAPPGRVLLSVASDGTFLWLDHAGRASAPGALPGRLPDSAFFWVDAGAIAGRTFLAVATLFAAAAIGRPVRVAARFLGLVASLFVLDVVAFAALARFGYDPAAAAYDTVGVFPLGPWTRQAVPLALAWIAARPPGSRRGGPEEPRASCPPEGDVVD